MAEKVTYEKLQQLVENLGERCLEAETLYECLFLNCSSVMLVIDPDSGKILDANTAACKFYGYSRDEITSKKIMDINILPPAEIYQEMQNATEEKRSHFFFQHKLAGGDIKTVEVYSGPIILNGKNVLYSIIHDITERKTLEQEREQLIARLEKALQEIKTLKGILPVCAACKKIRDDKGQWKQLEVYIRNHFDAEFSHGICPDCARILYPDGPSHDDGK